MTGSCTVQEHESNAKRSRPGGATRDRDPVAGHADEPDEPLVARLERGFERAAGAQRRLPLVRLDQVVELDQVDVVDPQPLERPLELGSARVAACARRSWWRGRIVAVARHPRAEAKLGVAVARGGVDVVDAVRHVSSSVASASAVGHRTEAAAPKDHAGARGRSGRREGAGSWRHYPPPFRWRHSSFASQTVVPADMIDG